MRKALAEGRAAKKKLDTKTLAALENKGYRFLLVKGLTIDNHYDHVEPHYLVLVPVKELPRDPAQKDVYAPIGSDIIRRWATESDESTEIMVVRQPGI